MKRLKTKTLIIGAGPYGIGLANELSSRGEEFMITGPYMDLWFNHTPPQMRLRSEIKTSSLYHPQGLFDFSNFLASEKVDPDGFASIDLFRDYLLWCKERLSYSVQEERAVSVELVSKKEELSSGPGELRFRTTLSSGAVIDSQNVSVAVGLGTHRHIPEEFSHLKNVVHSYDVEKYGGVSNQDVVVIGAGQSAFEAAELLERNQNRVSFFYRHKPHFMNQPVYVPQFFFEWMLRSPGWFSRLGAPLRRMVKRIVSRSTATRNYKELFEKTLRAGFDELSSAGLVVAATGFLPRMGDLKFLSPEILSQVKVDFGAPALGRNFESSLAGLYFLGPITENRFGPVMRFIIGSHYASVAVADLICGEQ